MTDTFYGSDFGALESFDPDIAGVLALRARPHPRRSAAHREREHRAPEVLTALGSTLSNKYAEGYPGRRYYGGCSEVDKAETLAIERCKALFDADHANVQAALRCQRQPGRLRRLHAARRHDPRDGPAARRPPHPRHQGVLLRQVVQRRPLRRRQGDRGHRLRPGRGARPRAPPQGDPRRRLGHPAAHRLRALPGRSPTRSARSSGSTPPTSSASSPARRSPARCPYADVVSFTTHKVLRGPRSRRHRLQGGARGRHRQGGLPDDAGRPADAHDRGQGGQLQGVRDARVPGLRPAGHRQRHRSLAEALGEKGIRPTTGGTDTHLSLHDLQRRRGHRRRRRGALRRGRHRAEQERHPVRPAEAQHRLRHPGRHAVRDDPGHGHRGDAQIAELIAPGRDQGRRRPRPRGLQGGPRPR